MKFKTQALVALLFLAISIYTPQPLEAKTAGVRYVLVSLLDYEDPNCGEANKFQSWKGYLRVAYYEGNERVSKLFKKSKLNIQKNDGIAAPYLIMPSSQEGRTADIYVNSKDAKCVE